MNPKRLPLSWFVGKLNSHNPFSFVRYGDGELNAMLGVTGHNCDRHEYFTDLGEALRETINKPREYYYAIGPKVATRDTRFMQLAKAYLEITNIEWYDSEVFLTASLNGTLLQFVEALRNCKLMLVGAEHLERIPLKRISFIQVPIRNAWEQHADIYASILRQSYQVDAIVFCAGMTTKVLIWELFAHLGQTHTMIDIGSTFDMYCGVRSRSYARVLNDTDIQRLQVLNFGADIE